MSRKLLKTLVFATFTFPVAVPAAPSEAVQARPVAVKPDHQQVQRAATW